MTDSPRLVILGEAYGEREAMFRHPFVGASGRELAKMLGQSGLAEPLKSDHASELQMIAHWKSVRASGIELTNVFNERPPNNDLEARYFTGAKEGLTSLPPLSAGKYLRPEFLPHLESLWELLRELRPNLILALGNSACWAVLGATKISKIRGTVAWSERLGTKILPTYHPAAILRNWSLRPIAIADFTKAAREVQFPEIRRRERWVLENPTLDEIYDWLRVPAERFAVDIESGRALFTEAEIKAMPPGQNQLLNEQISMVGFARDPSHAMVIPFMTRAKPDFHFWPDTNSELRAWRALKHGLRLPVPKIFQNGMYDISRLLAYGIAPARCADDTMLLHHAIFPELSKGLGFLGSVYANEVSWKEAYAGGENLKRDD